VPQRLRHIELGDGSVDGAAAVGCERITHERRWRFLSTG
jgi:hypothetical protein